MGTPQVEHPDFQTMHKLNEHPEGGLFLLDVVQQSRKDDVHALNVTDLGVVLAVV